MKKPTNTYDYYQLLQSVQKASATASRILLDHFGNLSQVNEKLNAGLVSEADRSSEEEIKRILSADFPEIEFLGEEESFGKDAYNLDKRGATWVVDPLDGTTNYVHRFPVFCVSIGLVIDGEIVLGVVDAPMMHKNYWAIRGEGAYCNDQKISVSHREELQKALMATGFFTSSQEALEEQLRIFNSILNKSPRGIRRAGSAAYDLCMVAEGIFDGFWERNLQPWDMCAGALLVEEAGGSVTNYSGDVFKPDMRSILAASPRIHDEMIRVIARMKN